MFTRGAFRPSACYHSEANRATHLLRPELGPKPVQPHGRGAARDSHSCVAEREPKEMPI